MKKKDYMLWLSVAAAAGTAAGIIAERKHPARGGILGAVSGVVAGSVAAGFYHYVTEARIPFYSDSSPLYEESEAA